MCIIFEILFLVTSGVVSLGFSYQGSYNCQSYINIAVTPSVRLWLVVFSHIYPKYALINFWILYYRNSIKFASFSNLSIGALWSKSHKFCCARLWTNGVLMTFNSRDSKSKDFTLYTKKEKKNCDKIYKDTYN